MEPEIRRIIAVDAHRRRTGRCPTTIHSLGTGESFAVEPAADGFTDVASGLKVRSDPTHIMLQGDGAVIDLAFEEGNIVFSGHDSKSGENFTGRAGGGSSVTIYDADQTQYFQYAVAEESK